MTNVSVWASDSALREALRVALTGFTSVRVLPDLGSCRLDEPAVLVAPSSDCPPEACRRLTSERWRVVILAALPRETDRLAYLGAGATGYIPMTVGLDALCTAISQASLVA